MVYKTHRLGGQGLLPRLYAHGLQGLMQGLTAFYPTVEATDGIAAIGGLGEVLKCEGALEHIFF